MKGKTLFLAVCCVVGLIAGQASADMVSFLSADSFAGVDDDTSGWPTDDTLGVSSLSLLGGMASVDAYINGGSGTLYERATRGLGVLGGTNDDEVESSSVSGVEKIEITFPTLDYYVNSLEVRSLFIETDGTEQGVVDFYLDGSVVDTQNLVAVQSTGNGVLAISYGTPVLVDKLVFHVPTGQTYTNFSELAVAKLDVDPVPVPGAVLLGILGLGAVGVKLRKHA